MGSCLYPMYRDDESKTCYSYLCAKCSEYLQPSQRCKSYSKVGSEFNCTECVSSEYARLRAKCGSSIYSDCIAPSSCVYTAVTSNGGSEVTCYKSNSGATVANCTTRDVAMCNKACVGCVNSSHSGCLKCKDARLYLKTSEGGAVGSCVPKAECVSSEKILAIINETIKVCDESSFADIS